MLALPSPLRTTDVPQQFAASMLGSWGGCVAKLALGSLPASSTLQLLAAGPAAATGTLAHRVLERWTRGAVETSPGEVFDAVYGAMADELRADPVRRHFANLAEVIGLAQWSSLRAWVVQRCEAAGKGRSRGASAGGLPDRTIGVEVPIASEALRLRGRIDRVRRVGERSYEIRDYKSGAVLDENGEVNDEVTLQLQVYGLMYMERHPDVDVALVVDTGSEHTIPFDADARDRAKMRIAAMMASLPAAGEVKMEDVATPGGGCLGCRARHVCPAYYREAPQWWAEYPAFADRVPNDSWGTVTEVRTGVSRTSVTLLDQAGRRVRVDGLDARHRIDGSLALKNLYLFNLEGSGPSRDFKGRRYQPRIFHELPRDRRERRAWSLQCFVGAGR